MPPKRIKLFLHFPFVTFELLNPVLNGSFTVKAALKQGRDAARCQNAIYKDIQNDFIQFLHTNGTTGANGFARIRVLAAFIITICAALTGLNPHARVTLCAMSKPGQQDIAIYNAGRCGERMIAVQTVMNRVKIDIFNNARDFE